MDGRSAIYRFVVRGGYVDLVVSVRRYRCRFVCVHAADLLPADRSALGGLLGG